MKKKILIGTLVVLYMLFVLFKYTTAKEKVPVAQNGLTIVTSFYPMYIHTQALTKGIDVEVVNMASPEIGCLHDYQLTVENMRILKDADILVINGLGAENFIDKAVEQNPHLQVMVASSTWEEAHSKDETETDHDHHDGDGHDHENQHLWMSVVGSISQAKTISQGLQQADPANAPLYKVNEQTYIQELEALLGEIEQLKADLGGHHLVMVHETFAYMAEELGLESIGIIAADEKSSLAAHEVEELVASLNAYPDAVIFTESQYRELGIVRTIAKESGKKIYELDSLVTGGTSKTYQGYEYIDRMKHNMSVLKEAYGL